MISPTFQFFIKFSYNKIKGIIMEDKQNGFFGSFYELVNQISSQLTNCGEKELSDKLEKSIQQIEALIKNLNDALYSSYKLSYNLIVAEMQIPEETKTELKENLIKLINVYEKG